MAYPVLPLSIRGLFNKSSMNQLILPALQRDYVWKAKDICKLFDSLLQGYPINTMMFWNVSNIASQPIAFYQFLSPNYTEGDTNTLFNTSVCPLGQQFDVVIDGQQRITSLLIGFSGSYKTPKAKTPSYLYLRLDKANTNPDLIYDFQFLSASKLSANQAKGEVWFRVMDVLNPSFNVIGTLNVLGMINNAYAQLTLNNLANIVTNNNVLHYYDISGSNIDDVLEIFVRTNSGGYTLKKGDLLMSALTVNWANAGYPLNARDYVEDIIDDVETIGYKIDKDWVFNAFLMLTGANISLKVSAFMTGHVAATIYNYNLAIRESINKAFQFVASFHLLEKGLTTKLAVLPIAYFIYKFGLAKTSILSTNSMSAVYGDMRKFLFRAIVQNLFEAGTDEIIKGLRNIIDTKGTKNMFPYADIEAAYSKLKVTASDITKLLDTRKANAFPVLNIIYALGYDGGYGCSCPVPNNDFDVDHMHPKKGFESSALSTITFTTANDSALANDKVTFDTIPNLELLDTSTNRSKNKQPLASWLAGVPVANQTKLAKDHFFDGLPTGLQDFGTFINGRKGRLEQVLRTQL